MLSITNEMYKSLDDGLEIRRISDISKAFDKVWYDGVIFKLEQNDISGDLLNNLIEFLCNRKQRVVLNVQVSAWASVNGGVPQWSIVGPLLFLIYINDLSDNLSSNVKQFAGDTSLFSVTHDVNVSAGELNDDLRKTGNWTFNGKWVSNQMLINKLKKLYLVGR